MPSKKRKYNARFPAGRIKKIMQTDEEVGKVAQAVPIIISRTLEMFVESLLKKAMQVTVSRNAKTLSPSHVKQCILAESRFDFLKDLVKNIPDVSAAEEKELQMSAESSPNSSRFPETPAPPRRIARQDSNSSSSGEVRPIPNLEPIRRTSSVEDPKPKPQTVTTTEAIDLTTKKDDKKPRIANFYQETLIEPVQHRSVITVNPTYSSPQPSTSNYANMTPVAPTVPTLPKETVQRIEAPKPEITPLRLVDLVDVQKNFVNVTPPRTPATPITPVINIDFTRNLGTPVIEVLDTSVASMVVKEKIRDKLQRQHSRKSESNMKPVVSTPTLPIRLDYFTSGDLQIDEDYDT